MFNQLNYKYPNCALNELERSEKVLTAQEFEHFKRLMKQIVAHKSAWPFLKALDPKVAVEYYKKIKYPMGKREIIMVLISSLNG